MLLKFALGQFIFAGVVISAYLAGTFTGDALRQYYGHATAGHQAPAVAMPVDIGKYLR